MWNKRVRDKRMQIYVSKLNAEELHLIYKLKFLTPWQLFFIFKEFFILFFISFHMLSYFWVIHNL